MKIYGEEKMIDEQWEDIFTRIINSERLVNDLKFIIQEIIDKKIATTKYFFRDNSSRVVIAYDSRKSSVPISELMM